MRALLVGATGVLRPAAVMLARAGHDVVALARSPERLADLQASEPGIRIVATDYTDWSRLSTDLPRGPFDAVVAYCPTACQQARQLMMGRASSTSVELLTSSAADPSLAGEHVDLDALPTEADVVVLLGWSDRRRWHTPAEISAAALLSLSERRSRVLGRVRPWAERPA